MTWELSYVVWECSECGHTDEVMDTTGRPPSKRCPECHEPGSDEPAYTHVCQKDGTKAALPVIRGMEWEAKCPKKGCRRQMVPIGKQEKQ